MDSYEKRKESIIIFCVFMLIYAVIGLGIVYYNGNIANMFFGADNARAFGDFSSIGYNHYRVKVHPLLLMMTQPITLVVKSFFHNASLSVFFLEILCGSGSVGILYFLLRELEIDRRNAILWTILYGFSFSNLIFVSVPETFIVGCFFQILFWTWLIHYGNNNSDISGIAFITLLFFAAVCTGSTITNCISFAIGTIYLGIKLYTDKKVFFKFVGKTFCCSAAFVLLLNAFQRLAWKSPYVLSQFKDLFFNAKNFEEIHYMHFGTSFSKVEAWLNGIFAQSFVPSKIVLNFATNPKWHKLSNSVQFDNCKPMVFWAILAFIICLVLLAIYFRKEIKLKHEFLALNAFVLFNLVLHYFYGAREAFMYIPHYLFAVVAVIGMIFYTISSRHRWLYNLMIITLTSCGLVEISKNLFALSKLYTIVGSVYHNPMFTYIQCVEFFVLIMGIVGFCIWKIKENEIEKIKFYVCIRYYSFWCVLFTTGLAVMRLVRKLT